MGIMRQAHSGGSRRLLLISLNDFNSILEVLRAKWQFLAFSDGCRVD
jgi:hypothetical protein